MTEEEKKAIKFIKYDMFEFEEIDSSVLEEFNNVHKIILNLIKKQKEEIKELKEDNKSYKYILDMQNKREYRSKFLKDFQKENGKNMFPDYDEIYKRYDKQKEEIERLKNAEEYAKLGKETLLDTIHKQEKEIKELKKPKFIFNAETGVVTKIDNDFISKDKIRDKIKNEEKEIKEIEYLQKIDNTMALCDEKAYRQHKIDILKELLEEK